MSSIFIKFVHRYNFVHKCYQQNEIKSSMNILLLQYFTPYEHAGINISKDINKITMKASVDTSSGVLKQGRIILIYCTSLPQIIIYIHFVNQKRMKIFKHNKCFKTFISFCSKEMLACISLTTLKNSNTVLNLL